MGLMRIKKDEKPIEQVIIKEEKNEVITKPEKIKDDSKKNRLFDLLEQSAKRQEEILKAIEDLKKPKQETRQEVLNPAKTDEEVAADLLKAKHEKEQKNE